MSDELLTVNQVVAIVKRSEQTLKLWIKKGKGPKYLKDEFGKVRYKKSDVEKWIGGGNG